MIIFVIIAFVIVIAIIISLFSMLLIFIFLVFAIPFYLCIYQIFLNFIGIKDTETVSVSLMGTLNSVCLTFSSDCLLSK